MKTSGAAILTGVVAAMTITAKAGAQEATSLGSKGQLLLGAERLFGYDSWSQESSASGLTAKVQGSNFSFLWGASSSSGGGTAPAPGATPRLGLDYLAFDVPVTLGGTFGYASGSGSQDLPTGVGRRRNTRICRTCRRGRSARASATWPRSATGSRSGRGWE